MRLVVTHAVARSWMEDGLTIHLEDLSGHVCATLPSQKVIRHEQCPGLPLQPDLAQIVSVSFRTGNWYPKHLGVEVACDF